MQDGLSEILGSLLRHMACGHAVELSDSYRLDFDRMSPSMMLVVLQLYPLFELLCMADGGKVLFSSTHFIEFLLDEDRAGRFHLVLWADTLTAVLNTLSSWRAFARGV